MADDRDDLFGGQEPTGGEWDDRREPIDEGARRPGGRRGWKIAIIVLLIMLVAIVLCCGGLFWSVTQNMESTTSDETIRAWTGEMLSIEIPDDYTAIMGTKFSVFGFMNVANVSYRGPSEMELHLVAMTGAAARDPQSHAQLEPSLRNFLGQQGRMIQEEASEIHELEIDGQTIDFKLVTGTDARSGEKWQELRGLISTSRGVVLIAFQGPTETFDKEAAIAVLKTIKIP